MLSVVLRQEQDVVVARQRARQVARLLGFGPQDETRIATAVSEIARNALSYANGGEVEFTFGQQPRALLIRVRDEGPGIAHLADVLSGQYRSATGLGLGIVGAQRLMNRFEITSVPGAGTTVLLAKHLPPASTVVDASDWAALVAQLSSEPQDLIWEVKQQNQELLKVLDELSQLNRELAETNRGVVALYTELEEKAHELAASDAALRRSNAELRRSNEDLQQFAYAAGHDLQEPLRSIAGYTQLLARRYQGQLGPEADEFIQFVVGGAARMRQMIQDLLEYSRVAEAAVADEAVDGDTALRVALENLQVRIDETGASVTQDQLPIVRAEFGQLARLFQNLVGNALKYRQVDQPPRVHISVAPQGPHWQFSVRDNGIGFPPREADRIFGIFTRLHRDRYPGTGIGLAVCKRIVERCGGSIWAESEPGQGSVFHFTLPLLEDEGRTVASGGSSADTRKRGLPAIDVL